MNIEQALKENMSLRVSDGTRWLVWCGDRWEVYERFYAQRKTRLVYGGASLELALKDLLYE